MADIKVGLALGSGSARGLAHIGVLKVLVKEGIPIDMIAGTSAGAIIGGMYATGMPVTEIENTAKVLSHRKYAFLVDPTLPRTGLIKGKKVKEALKQYFKDTDFQDLKMPFACVSTDLETGEAIIIKTGKVLEAVDASISIPIIFSMVEKDGRHLVDGGLVNPVPVSVLKDMGADYIIAVNVTPYNIQKTEFLKTHGIFHVIMQTLYISTYQITRASLSNADVVIEPATDHISPFAFDRINECIELGEKSAQKAIIEIKQQLSDIRNGLRKPRSGDNCR